MRADIDRRFSLPTVILRWTAAAVALAAVAVGDGVAELGTLELWAGIVLAHTVVRTVWPITGLGRRWLVAIVAETLLMCIVASSTGGFESPFAFCLIPPIAITAFRHGVLGAAVSAVITTIAVGTPMVAATDATTASRELVLQWAAELLLVGGVASYAHLVVRQSEERHRHDRDTADRLADTNHLLATLHEVTQDLPATLDLDDALESVFDRVRGLVPVNYGGIALRDDGGDEWRFVAHLGPVDPVDDAHDRLGNIRRQLSTCVLTTSPGSHLYPDMSDGRYVALRARGELIGVLAVEHNTAGLYDRRHDDALVLVAQAAALAIDNARLFGRIHHLAASEERTRIARDLHDRMGQSLAYMGFELDRIARGTEGVPVHGEVVRLREFLRELTGDVRETLYDLRSDSDEIRTVSTVLDEFGSRVTARSGLDVTISIDDAVALAAVRERELCRITKEALINAERHSGGTHAHVEWRSTPTGVVATIADNGRGIDPSAARSDSYGLVGMRERAAAIAAEMTVESPPTGGTVVRITVPDEVAREARRVSA